jgi:urease accessory protein
VTRCVVGKELDREAFSLTLFSWHQVPRKGGPGISQSDILVINKIDLAPHVGASLEVMKRDADKMRDGGPTIFTSVKLGTGVDDVIELILKARTLSGADGHGKRITA